MNEKKFFEILEQLEITPEEVLDEEDFDELEDDDDEFDTEEMLHMVTDLLFKQTAKFATLASVMLKDNYAMINIIDDEDFQKTHELIEASSYKIQNGAIRHAIRVFGYPCVNDVANTLLDMRETLKRLEEKEKSKEKDNGEDS